MNPFLKGLSDVVKAYLRFLASLPDVLGNFLWFLDGLWRAIRNCLRRAPRDNCCLKLPPGVYVRPDPMIYDQYYLMSQGLAVTWDNPDIDIFDTLGNPVSSFGLNPDQDYNVVVRVWNNSYDAPAAGLPVLLSFLSFGIGITDTFVGATTTNLGVKGSAQCPAFANFAWHTPAVPGHYCLQALLVWPDDANPANNLGQRNTQVGKLASPALFTIDVHNRATIARRFEIEADMYRLPALAPCSGNPREVRIDVRKQGRYAESRARWDAALRTQAYGMFPVRREWNVAIDPRALDIGPGETSTVQVSIEPASGTFTGAELFNIHGFASSPGVPRTLAGGVTLQVKGS